MTIERSSHGNHMRIDANFRTKPDPDDYAVCLDCNEQDHVDNLVQVNRGQYVCRPHFETRENEFTCNFCGDTFKVAPLPDACPKCGSANIYFEYTVGNQILLEHQSRAWYRQLLEPSETMKAIYQLQH